MPEEPMFRLITKYCEVCGSPLALNTSRDIHRKRFCSKQCLVNGINPAQYVPPHSVETREKMRQSKLDLLKTGWLPVGWRKYLPYRRVGGRGYAFLGHKREHQVIIERLLGRSLKAEEVVHHRDGNKTNNDIYNLQVMTRSEHIKYHSQQRRLLYATTSI